MAPLAPGFLFIVLDSLLSTASSNWGILIAFMVWVVSYILTFTFGLLGLILLDSYYRITIKSLLISGAVLGACSFTILIGSMTGDFSLISIIWGAILGATISVTYGYLSKLGSTKR